MPFNIALLQPGDTLLYRPSPFSWRSPLGWLAGRIIARKTWRRISHVEVYRGADRGVHCSYASRDGIGVGSYPLRTEGLAYVLRPPAKALNFLAGDIWFLKVRGQKYDWWGLTRFVRTSDRPDGDRQFCSAFWLRYYRVCGFNPFSARIDADSVAPGEILDAPELTVAWTDGEDGSPLV